MNSFLHRSTRSHKPPAAPLQQVTVHSVREERITQSRKQKSLAVQQHSTESQSQTHKYQPICTITDIGTIYHTTTTPATTTAKTTDARLQHGYLLQPDTTLLLKQQQNNSTQPQTLQYIIQPSQHLSPNNTILFISPQHERYKNIVQKSTVQKGSEMYTGPIAYESDAPTTNLNIKHMDNFWGDENVGDEDETGDDWFREEDVEGYEERNMMMSESQSRPTTGFRPRTGRPATGMRPKSRMIGGRPQSALRQATETLLVRAQSATGGKRRTFDKHSSVSIRPMSSGRPRSAAILGTVTTAEAIAMLQGRTALPTAADRLQVAASDDEEHGSDIEEEGYDKQKPEPACSVCTTSPMTDPWLSQCHHLACSDCWVNYLQNAGSNCPECSAAVDVEQLKAVQICCLCHQVAGGGDDSALYTTPCNHTACKTCWQQLIGEEIAISCPVCEALIDASAIK